MNRLNAGAGLVQYTRTMDKRELGREILENMDLTKEQYMELCALCDELDLEKKGEEPKEERELSWEELDRLQ